MVLMKGAEVSARLKQEVERLREELAPLRARLAIVRVGQRPDDCSYERGARKKLESFGLEAVSYAFPEDISGEAFKAAFAAINQDPQVTGILLLRPLPRQICQREIEEMIDPSKDVDGISPVNIAKVFAGDETGFAPCTAEAVIQLLKAYEVPIEGKRAVVLGRSMVVGRPLSMMLLKENATVTICHTRTRQLEQICREADILVAAAGRAELVTGEFVKKNAVVIDVGIHVDEEGRLRGDVKFSSIQDTASMATPVPGGVGAATTAVLASHLARALQLRSL